MYTIMAKAEEVTQAMKSMQAHATRMYPFQHTSFFCIAKVIIFLTTTQKRDQKACGRI